MNFENWRDIYNSKPEVEIKKDIADLRKKIETYIVPSNKEEVLSSSTFKGQSPNKGRREDLNTDNNKRSLGVMEYLGQIQLIFSEMDEKLLHFPMYFLSLLLLYVFVYIIRVHCYGNRSKIVKKVKKL